jgi:hypothetical protein
MPVSHLSSITPEVLCSLFVHSEKEAAKILGVCLTSLKKASRKHGIHRWPYRKIKSDQLRDSRSARRSSSNTRLRTSTSPRNGGSDFESESSSEHSSNTVKRAHSDSSFKEQAPAEATIYNLALNNQSSPPPIYSFDDVDSHHDGCDMWISAIEENSLKKVPQQQQQQYQRYELEQPLQHIQHQPHHRYPQSQFVYSNTAPPYGHFHHPIDLEYSDVPVLYSRPIDATSYML